MTVKIIQSDLIKDQTNIYCLLIIRLIFVLQRNLLIVTMQDFTKLSTSLQEFKTLNIEN